MFEQIIGFIGAVLVCVVVFAAIVAVAVWIIEGPDRREERNRRRSYLR